MCTCASECVCIQAPMFHDECRGQRTIFSSWFSHLIMGSGFELRSLDLYVNVFVYGTISLASDICFIITFPKEIQRNQEDDSVIKMCNLDNLSSTAETHLIIEGGDSCHKIVLSHACYKEGSEACIIWTNGLVFNLWCMGPIMCCSFTLYIALKHIRLNWFL